MNYCVEKVVFVVCSFFILVFLVNLLEYNFDININDVWNDLKYFWRSIGFCLFLFYKDVYKFDFSKDM